MMKVMILRQLFNDGKRFSILFGELLVTSETALKNTRFRKSVLTLVLSEPVCQELDKHLPLIGRNEELAFVARTCSACKQRYPV